MADQLANQLYESIREEMKERPMMMWHASSLAMCPRAQFLQRKGAPAIQVQGPGRQLMWDVGHDTEGRIRPHLKKIFPKLVSNERLDDRELDLTGEFDNYDPDSKTLIEIKTVGPRAIRYKKVDEDRYNLKEDKPYYHHEIQNHAYALLMARDATLVKHINYVYISREGLIATYETHVQPDIIEEVEMRLNILNKAWTTGEAPACICNDDTYPRYAELKGGQMQFCPYKTDWNCCEVPVPEATEGVTSGIS